MLSNLYKKYDFEDDYDVYLYGHKVFLFSVITNVSLLIFGCIFNQVFFSIIWIISFSGLRIYLGGYHCSTATRCFFLTHTVFLTSLLVHCYFKNYIIVLILPLIVLLIKLSHEQIIPRAKKIIIFEIILIIIFSNIRNILLITLTENLINYFIQSKNN